MSIKIAFYDDYIYPLIVKLNRPTGGASVQAFAWIRGLKEFGADVSVITPLSKPTKVELIGDLKVFGIADKKKGIRFFRWFTHRIPSLYLAILRTKADYIYYGVPSNIGGLIAIICKIQNKKMILRVSNNNLVDNRVNTKHSIVYLWLFRLGFSLSDFIIVQNDYQLVILRKKFPSKSICKIYNPFYFNTTKTYDTNKKNGYIAWIGLFQYQKNLPLLYDIVKENRFIKFLIAGTKIYGIDEETSFALARLIECKNVEFTGLLDRDGVVELLKGANCLLNTSHYEGFSNTFLESLSNGTPIICPAKVDPDGLINKSGVGLTYINIGEASSAIKYLTSLKYTEYDMLSKKCVLMSKQNFSTDVIIPKLIEFVK